MRSGHKDGFPTNPVHVDAGASFKVIQVDVAILCDEKDHILLRADLQEKKQQSKITSLTHSGILEQIITSLQVRWIVKHNAHRLISGEIL